MRAFLKSILVVFLFAGFTFELFANEQLERMKTIMKDRVTPLDIKGTVLNEDGLPVSGAVVKVSYETFTEDAPNDYFRKVNMAELETNASGKFELKGIVGYSAYVNSIHKDGYLLENVVVQKISGRGVADAVGRSKAGKSNSDEAKYTMKRTSGLMKAQAKKSSSSKTSKFLLHTMKYPYGKYFSISKNTSSLDKLQPYDFGVELNEPTSFEIVLGSDFVSIEYDNKIAESVVGNTVSLGDGKMSFKGFLVDTNQKKYPFRAKVHKKDTLSAIEIVLL